jgi:hypothetical protein
MLEIQPINIEFLNSYQIQLKKEKLGFCKNTELFGCFDNSNFVGFTGILWYQNKAVFKNHFVFVDKRKQGIFTFMLQYSINRVKNTKIKLIEANCLPNSVPAYLKIGGKIVKTFGNCERIHINL